MEDFGKALAAARSGMSQFKLAAETGVSLQLVSRIELGHHAAINLKTLKKLCDTTGLDIGESAKALCAKIGTQAVNPGGEPRR